MRCERKVVIDSVKWRRMRALLKYFKGKKGPSGRALQDDFFLRIYSGTIGWSQTRTYKMLVIMKRLDAFHILVHSGEVRPTPG